MAYNTDVEQEKMAKIALAFGVNPAGKTEKELAEVAWQEVFKLVEAIGLPTRLSQIGIKEEDLAEIASKSLGINLLIRNNPRVPTQKSLEELLRKAL